MKIAVFAFLLGLLAVGLPLARAFEPVVPLPDDPKCTAEDRKFMARAMELAVTAAAHGNGAYGAVLVKNGIIIMEYDAQVTSSGDVTQHAETGLISRASRKFGKSALADAVLYTSTEPCIMCCGSISAAGIKKFVYGVTATQVIRLRGSKLPFKPLECRENFARRGLTDVVILGPLMEADGLQIHAAQIAGAQMSKAQ
jgi:tRNA(Arg) A34 adenosine deaminase TadA